MENRVTAIQRLVPPEYRQHCPRREYPADIPSRGMGASELSESPLWLNGPDWLWYKSSKREETDEDTSPPDVPEECQREMKRKNLPSCVVAINTAEPPVDMSQVICPKQYSSSHRLFRVTALVLRFVEQTAPWSTSYTLNCATRGEGDYSSQIEMDERHASESA